MKFVCDNCKAKYQIGDDKIAGKTVRMKCRKCGHLIQVSALLTEQTLVGKLAPEGSSPTLDADAAQPAGAHTRSPTMVPTSRELSDDDGEGDESTQLFETPPAPPKKPTAGAVAQPSTSTPAASKLPTAGAPPPRPGAAPPPARPLAAPTPRPPPAPLGRPGGASLPRPASSPVTPIRPGLAARPAPAVARAPGPPVAAASAQPTAPPAPAGVEEAFRRALTDSSPQLKSTPTEDWYVGIGGVPVGPVRLSVLREKALAGAVHPESLVWREGFDEWVPLKKFPELLELVEAAQKHTQPRRPSSTSLAAVRPEAAPAKPEPRLAEAAELDDPPTEVVGAGGLAALAAPRAAAAGEAHVEARAPTPSAAVAAPVVGAPAATATAGAPTIGAPTVGAPIIGAPIVAAPTIEPAFAPAAKATDPATEPASDASKGAALGLLGDPFAAASAPAAATTSPTPALASAATSPVSVHEPLPAGVPQKRGVHPMAWAFVAAAAVFGGVAAYFTFAKKPAAETKIVYLPSSTEAGSAAPRGGPDLPPPPVAQATGSAAPEASASASAKVASAAGVAGMGKPGASPSASPSASPGSFDNSGLAGGPGVVGPSATATGTAGGSSGGQLTQGEIQGVVSSRQAIVRRKCWQPALDARTNPSATTARVTANIVIGPSGSVQSASVSGSEKDFPGLSSCIAADVKGWKFPASGGTTPVTVPFVFAAQ